LGDRRDDIKSCCAAFYQSDIVRVLLGDVLHPGGLALTEHLGGVLQLGPGERVLDIACGRGASAVHLAKTFGCHVTGTDFSADSLAEAEALAASQGVAELTRFQLGDAEQLPFDDNSFHAVISECSLCTFPDKRTAVEEMMRVLQPGGRLGITDVTVGGTLPDDIKSVLGWVACVAGAASTTDYMGLLGEVGLSDFTVEDHRDAGKALVEDIRRKLLGLEMVAELGKLDLGEVDPKGTREVLRRVSTLIDEGVIGYALIAASKT
jgi:arsenite methyltransferase